jgi:titin
VPGQISDLVASQGLFPGEIDLSWSAPADGGNQIQSYSVCRGTAPGAESQCFSAPSPGYADTTATTDVQYWYTVVATNAVGSSVPSNEASATAP